jgi:hypothetical protein
VWLASDSVLSGLSATRTRRRPLQPSVSVPIRSFTADRMRCLLGRLDRDLPEEKLDLL